MSEVKYKSIPLENAVNTVLAHDITQIVPGGFKGPAFKKGHVISEEDIPKFLDLGKKNIYVLDIPEGFIHENDAAERISGALAGKGIKFTGPKEGRINLLAAEKGLLKINSEAVHRINSVEDVMLATVHTNQQVWHDTILAGTRITPLATKEKNILEVEKICADYFPVIEVSPFNNLKVGLITTGSEVFSGRIKDGFGPVLRKKFSSLDCEVVKQVFVSDEIDRTVKAIEELIDEKVDLIALTGGMSVDPDDQTAASIRAAGAEVVAYGAPVLPGTMFMLAYIGNVPVIGLPGAVMYFKASIFDLIVPLLVAGERVTKDYIISLGYGGLCSGCKECRYPVCGFGKQ